MIARRILLAILAWFGAGVAGASLPATGVLDLAEPVRAIGLGGAGCAVAGDPTLGSLNPAAGAGASDRMISLTGSRGMFGDLTGQAQGALPVAGGMLTVCAAYLDAGVLSYTTPSGVTGSVAAEREILVGLRAARAVSKRVAFGGAVSVIDSELFETAHGRAVTADVGVRATILPWLAFGAAYRGLGGAILYGGSGWRLPSGLLAGLAAVWAPDDRRHIVTGLVDVLRETDSGDLSIRLGAEYGWRSLIILRVGIIPAAAGFPTRFGGGLGLSHGRLRLDYGLRVGGPQTIPHTISLTFRL